MAQHDGPEIVSTDDKQNTEHNGKSHYYRDRARALVEMNYARSECRQPDRPPGSHRNPKPGSEPPLYRPQYDASESKLFQNSSQYPRDENAGEQLHGGLLYR